MYKSAAQTPLCLHSISPTVSMLHAADTAVWIFALCIQNSSSTALTICRNIPLSFLLLTSSDEINPWSKKRAASSFLSVSVRERCCSLLGRQRSVCVCVCVWPADLGGSVISCCKWPVNVFTLSQGEWCVVKLWPAVIILSSGLSHLKIIH